MKRLYNYINNIIDYGYFISANKLVADLSEYIVDELQDSRYYAILAQKAPTTRAKNLILEFSADEKMHAQNFMKAYKRLTGKNFVVPKITDPVVPEYKEAIEDRIIAETNDYKKYGQQYLNANDKYFKDLFFMTRTAEATHAMRMPLLLAEQT